MRWGEPEFQPVNKKENSDTFSRHETNHFLIPGEKCLGRFADKIFEIVDHVRLIVKSTFVNHRLDIVDAANPEPRPQIVKTGNAAKAFGIHPGSLQKFPAEGARIDFFILKN